VASGAIRSAAPRTTAENGFMVRPFSAIGGKYIIKCIILSAVAGRKAEGRIHDLVPAIHVFN
jgi:hypothetical protein